ncbi:MAG: PAS domain S-box protein [Chloroflexi bacterium]|nr:PAS domain S-box protein [Chloroflexota bacterium]
MKPQEQMDNSFSDLIETIHFSEKVATKIHGLRDESEILRTIKEEFAKSNRYVATILFLTENGASLQVITSSLSSSILKAMEKAAGLSLKTYTIDLKKSSIFSKVVKEGETLQCCGVDILAELLPNRIVTAVAKIMGVGKEPSILTPLYRNEVVIGALTVTSPILSEHFLPSVRNLAQHISMALELADEYSERKRAGESLKESEERYRTLVENSEAPITCYDLDWGIRLINNVGATNLGGKPEDFMGRSIYEVVPDIAPAAVKRMRKVVETGLGREYEDLVEFPTRSYWLRSNMQPIRNASGDIDSVLVISQDITERKQAVEALKESEEKWRSLAENVPDIITTVDRNGTILFANHTIQGVAPDRAIGMSFYDYVLLEYREITQRSIERAFATGNPVDEYEALGNGPHGTTRWYACRVGPVKQEEEVVAVNVVATDVTERKNSEDEIMQRNRELNALNTVATMLNQSLTLEEILNNALDKVLEILDIENAGVTLLDNETESMVLEVHRGMSADLLEAVSKLRLRGGIMGRVVQLGEPIFIESLPDSLELLAEKAYKRVVIEQQLKSAIFVPLQVRGKVLGVMCAITRGDRVFTPEEREILNTVGQTISTAVENAQLLDEASRAEALEELDRLRTELLASVSHELRTPLTAIKGIAGTLVQSDIQWDAETQSDFLRTINIETDKLIHIVEDLMEMSQLEAGVIKMEKKQSRISAVVSQLRNQMASFTVKHKFEVAVPHGLPSIYIDEIRIGEVITNLVANAAAYSGDGTRIKLESERVGGDIVINVTDEGIGIRPEHIDKVFDRFYRLESGVARRRGGTGLGLAICRGIVEAHEGRIWVESKPGEGSTFSFSLPTMDKMGA